MHNGSYITPARAAKEQRERSTEFLLVGDANKLRENMISRASATWGSLAVMRSRNRGSPNGLQSFGRRAAESNKLQSLLLAPSVRCHHRSL
jgi:hypothetical protein